jgi:multicomponent Na+:H+ antiporter subunit G
LNGIAEIITAFFILVGTTISLLAAIGLVRLPDIYTRSHAASKSSTLGVLCVLIGTLLYFLISDGYFSIRLILGIFFVFLTAPVAAHVICRAAYRNQAPVADTMVEDELKEYYELNPEYKKKSIVVEETVQVDE